MQQAAISNLYTATCYALVVDGLIDLKHKRPPLIVNKTLLSPNHDLLCSPT